MKEIKSKPKKTVIDFLVWTRDHKDQPFEFTVNGDRNEAAKYLHRMRVELSRLRALVARNGKVPNSFKMLHLETKETSQGITVVKIQKSYSKNDVTDEINKIFDTISSGEMIDV